MCIETTPIQCCSWLVGEAMCSIKSGCRPTEYTVWDYCLKGLKNVLGNEYFGGIHYREGCNEWLGPILVSTIHTTQ